MRLPLAICGLGRFAIRRILPAITQCPDIELVAVVDRTGRAQDLPVSVRRFTSLDAFLATNPVGAVYIASPNFLHAQHSLQSLEAGLHVICEKPMATNSIDCQTMIKTARDLNLQLWVGHMLRYSPALKLAHQWFKQGLVGELQTISTIFHYELAETSRPWAFYSDRTGGGALMDAGIHCIDVIRNFTTEPISILAANLDYRSHDDGIERKAACHFVAGAVNCTVDINSQAPYKTLLTILGDKGKIIVNNFAATWGDVKVQLYSNDQNQLVKEELVDTSIIYNEQLRSFAKVVAEPNFAAFQDESAAENVRVIEKLYSIDRDS